MSVERFDAPMPLRDATRWRRKERPDPCQTQALETACSDLPISCGAMELTTSQTARASLRGDSTVPVTGGSMHSSIAPHLVWRRVCSAWARRVRSMRRCVATDGMGSTKRTTRASIVVGEQTPAGYASGERTSHDESPLASTLRGAPNPAERRADLGSHLGSEGGAAFHGFVAGNRSDNSRTATLRRCVRDRGVR